MQYTNIREGRQTNRHIRIVLTGLSFVLASLNTALGSTDFDWPQFHGPNRDNISHETGLMKKWPAQGPKLLWTVKGIGNSASIPRGSFGTL